MIVNVIISQLAADLINSNPVRTEMETTSNMIVETGQTIMLGGILYQKDTKIVQKAPFLGDLPIVGPLLFSTSDVAAANSEMIIFITPYVVDDREEGPLEPETAEIIDNSRQRLDEVTQQLNDAISFLMEGEI